MLKFDEKNQIESVAGALALRGKIEQIVDEICARGYDEIYYLGIGGTYASGLQVVTHIREMSAIPVYRKCRRIHYRGNRRINEKRWWYFFGDG